MVAGTIGAALTARAALYASGKLTTFLPYQGQTASEANDINDNGDVVGGVNFPEGSQFPLSCQHAALFHAGSVPTIYFTCSAGASSVATGINNSGEIVGYATPGLCDQTAIFTGGAVTLLSSDGIGEPAAVNSSGTIAATAFGTFVGSCLAGTIFPVEFNPPISIPLPADAGFGGDQGTSGGASSDINDHGEVVGSYNVCTQSYSCGLAGFVYAGGKVSSVYSPDASATVGCLTLNAVNNGGDVVGTICESNRRAILVVGGNVTDLNTVIRGHPHWHLSSAADINDSGAIVGSGTDNGVQHGFMLMPKFCPLPVRT